MAIKKHHAAIAMALTLAVAGAALWPPHSSNRTSRAGSGSGTAEDPARLEMEQRMSRLENEIESLKDLVSQSTHDAGRVSRSPPRRTEGENIAKQQERFKATLSSSFAAQPIDTAWALQTRVELEERLIATAAEQADFPAPQTARMQCRSTTCRIEADYPDEDSAMYGVQLLQSAFSSRLPRAHQYSVNNPDGSVTIVMYASKGST